MNFILSLVTKNPLVLLWLALGAFAAGAMSGGGAAWTVQGWRLDAVQSKFDGFVATTKVLGEAASKEKAATEKAHAKTTQEIRDEIPKKIAAARTNAVAAYRLRYPDAGSGNVSCPADCPGGTDATGEERVAAEWDSSAPPAFIEDSAHDAVTIDLWQTWARGIGFPIK
jgi:hypothetical protein